MVAREYEERVYSPVGDVRQDLPDGVGRALKPLGARRRLLGGEYLDEAVRELREAIGLRDVLVERCGVVLREHEDTQYVRVDAVREGDVYEPVLAAQGYGGLRALMRQRRQARARAAAEYNRENVRPLRSHRSHLPYS